MRVARWPLALLLVAAIDAFAQGPVPTFPARFANHERIVAVGVLTGRGIVRRKVERGVNDDVLVFDDPTRLHFEDADVEDPPLEATWSAPTASSSASRRTSC